MEIEDCHPAHFARVVILVSLVLVSTFNFCSAIGTNSPTSGTDNFLTGGMAVSFNRSYLNGGSRLIGYPISTVQVTNNIAYATAPTPKLTIELSPTPQPTPKPVPVVNIPKAVIYSKGTIQEKICSVFGKYCNSALIIVEHESGFVSKRSLKANYDGSYDWGLFQINDRWHCSKLGVNCTQKLLNVDTNIKIAWDIFKSSGYSFNQWYTCKYLNPCF